MYKVKLIKVNSSHNKLRTEEVDGIAYDLPKVCESFSMRGEGLEFGTRLVTTSEVQEVNSFATNEGCSFYFKTLNSVYVLKVLEELEDEEVLPI